MTAREDIAWKLESSRVRLLFCFGRLDLVWGKALLACWT